MFQNQIRSSLLALIVAPVLLAGCYGREVFLKVEDTSIVGKTPLSVKVTGDEYGVVEFKNNATSNIEVRMSKVRAFCSSEHARSLGSDFDGYILIEVYHNGKFAAKAQMDFKTEPSKGDFERVWRELQKALRWQISTKK